jgi:hypothetical protein
VTWEQFISDGKPNLETGGPSGCDLLLGNNHVWGFEGPALKGYSVVYVGTQANICMLLNLLCVLTFLTPHHLLDDRPTIIEVVPQSLSLLNSFMIFRNLAGMASDCLLQV